MSLNKLSKVTTRSKKRLGRGYGSGKGGHSASRGTKGQKSRSKVHLWFEGGQLPLVRRMPFQRGKGKFKTLNKKPIIINIKYLNILPKGTLVNLKNLAKYKLVRLEDATKYGVKILGDGKLEKALKVALPTSAPAAKLIKKAGGTIVKPKPKTKPTTKSKPKSKKKPVKKQAKKPVKKSTKKLAKKSTKKTTKS